MKILVTGKSGLIGSNLLDSLLKDGYDAIGTSTKDGDLRDSDYCLEVTKGVDVVFHCGKYFRCSCYCKIHLYLTSHLML